MKVGILAGGVGSRLSEETYLKPKPMVEIGGIPIMWHIMMHYAHFGHKEFVIALGYKGEYIKKWMLDYCNINAGNLSINLADGQVTQAMHSRPDWTVDLIDTGMSTGTGGRIKRLIPYLGTEGTFFMTWGDGVADIDLNALLDFHKSHGKLATMTVVRPPARFGYVEMGGDGRITTFTEKPQAAEGWINGAFFVLEPEVGEFIPDDESMFEGEPLQGLARAGQLMAYKHESFWQCMDTLRDKKRLEELWDTGYAPWKLWE